MDLPMDTAAPAMTLDRRLAARLAALRSELAMGERRLQALDEERHALRDALLRIAGAVEVLQVELAPAGPAPR